MSITKRTIIDPPSGWKYGFPKEVPPEVRLYGILADWLIEEGYPEKDIGLAMKYSRYWEVPSTE